jgi:Tol biopolymer transport system component
MSPDGQWVVFNRFEGTDYQAFIRKSDGVAAVKLGDGYGAGITWDAATVAAARNSEPHKLYLYPTGPGEQRVVDLGDLTAAYGTFENDVTFSRDGRWALFSAYNPQHEVRDYLMDMRDGKLRPVTPPGRRAGRLSSDGTRLVTLNITTQKYEVVEISSGATTDVAGLEKQDEVIRWGPDEHTVIVWNQELPARISLLDVASGKRQLVQTVEPLAMLGSMYARMVASADGKTAAYRHRRGLYAIYLADGLR